MTPCPVFGICGYSGAGKTTLIEELIRRLSERTLRVGVINHDAHGLTVDREGKDTDRFFKAGADVLIRGPAESFVRLHRSADAPLAQVVNALGCHTDLVLVEGHKTTPLAHKFWVCGPDGDSPPPEAGPILRVLTRQEDRPAAAMSVIETILPELWRAVPVYAGVLMGGRSTRMGTPKHLIARNGQTWLEHTVGALQGRVTRTVLLGQGAIPATLASLPVLPDAEESRGPLGGMRAALRWAPLVSWVFVPCDLPLLTAEAVQWLLDQRRPGAWAILPCLPGSAHAEPLLACYDFRAAALLETVTRPSDCAGQDKVSSPTIPARLASSWLNVNTPGDLAGLEPAHASDA